MSSQFFVRLISRKALPIRPLICESTKIMSDMTKILKSDQIEAGLAIAQEYLRKEFPAYDINIIDPDGPDGVPDRDLRIGPSRSFWLNFQGPQRIFFTIEILEALSKHNIASGLKMLTQLAIADFINNSACVPIKVTTDGPERL
jgi:hypothetical protein